MKYAVSLGFDAANKLVGQDAQNLVFNPERISGATGSSCVAFVWHTHLPVLPKRAKDPHLQACNR
ncbi:MAG: hypothetical protein IM613_08255 [Cytophagales bacterium]|nr:hypothetical protein [Cytophagales bacterium]